MNTRTRINSGDKGDRTARNLCKVFAARFNRPFERTVGSGNRWAQVKELSLSSRNVMVGDVVCPDGFRWVLECKGGYEGKIDFHGLFTCGNKTIDAFLVQVSADAERAKKKPMVLYKRNNRQWLAIVRTVDLPTSAIEYRLEYREWSCVALDALLREPDDFWQQ